MVRPAIFFGGTPVVPGAYIADMQATEAAELTQRHLISTGAMAPPTEAEGERDPYPLHLPTQEVFLLHKAHVELKAQAAHACFRILGLVETRPEPPQPWKGDFIALDPAMDTFLHPCFEPLLIGRQEYTPEVSAAKAQELLTAHREKLRLDKEIFEENVKEKRMGSVPPPPPSSPTAPAATLPTAAEDVRPCMPVSPMNEVRGQKLAVFSVLNGEEPVVTVYGAFENETDAKHYIDATLSKHVLDLDIFVHPMYEWIQLDAESMESPLVPRKYRHPILDAIMRKKRQQGSDIQQYYAKCQEAGIAPTITEVEAPPALEAAEETPPERTLLTAEEGAAAE